MQPELFELVDFFSRLQRQRGQFALPGVFDEQSSRALVLANAALRVARRRAKSWPLPLQLAVIGPTQSGKSTLVNLLLNQERAIASPLAGFTRHAQGFIAAESIDNVRQSIAELLPEWRYGEPQSEEERQGVFQLLDVAEGGGLGLESSLLWDTPDFDSVSSRSYRDTVPEICALADALLLVVSREKYADRSVWQLLRMLAPLGRPMMICLNKVAPTEVEALTAALQERLDKENIEAAACFVLPYVSGAGDALNRAPEAMRLRASVAQFLQTSAGQVDSEPPLELLRLNWPEWSLPLRGELAALTYWQTSVASCLEESRSDYQRDSLENPRYSFALQRAVIRLLELLEIPGIAAALVSVRSVLTWPARKLQGLLGSKIPLVAKDKNQEQQILMSGINHLLLELQRQAGEQLPVGSEFNRLWWRELHNLLVQKRDVISAQSQTAIDEYLKAFELDIEQASQRLFNHLQQHPATLNGLRAARVTTDAAAVAIALKTGGIGVNDLLLTPALLAFTSMLAEGAVGGYMKQVEAELKAQQMRLVNERLFDGLLLQVLQGLPSELAEERKFGVSEIELARVDTLLGVVA